MWWIVLIIVIILLIGVCVGLYIYINKRDDLSKKDVEATQAEQPRPIVKEEVKGEPLVSEKNTTKLESENISVRKKSVDEPVTKQNKYVKAVQKMSPEMKAIVFADIFKKKF